MITHIKYQCPKCNNIDFVEEIDPDHFKCLNCNNIISEEDLYQMSNIKSTARKIQSLNRQLESIKTAAFYEVNPENSESYMRPVGADSFEDMVDSLERRVRFLHGRIKGKLLYDMSNNELDSIKKDLNLIVEAALDAKAVMSDTKPYSGNNWEKKPAEFRAEDEQDTENTYRDRMTEREESKAANYKSKINKKASK